MRSTCTDHPLMNDLTDAQILRICHQLIGNYEDGGICVWLLITTDKYEALRVSQTPYEFVADSLELKNIVPIYMRTAPEVLGFGFMVDTSATLREILGELEDMAVFAYCHDFVVFVEPLATTKNNILLGDSSIQELM